MTSLISLRGYICGLKDARTKTKSFENQTESHNSPPEGGFFIFILLIALNPPCYPRVENLNIPRGGFFVGFPIPRKKIPIPWEKNPKKIAGFPGNPKKIPKIKKCQKFRALGNGIWDPRKIPSQSHLCLLLSG